MTTNRIPYKRTKCEHKFVDSLGCLRCGWRPKPKKVKCCEECGHPVDDHKYSWSGPWDWWECHCGCEIGH